MLYETPSWLDLSITIVEVRVPVQEMVSNALVGGVEVMICNI